MRFDIAEFLVAAAIRAPSLHNTQPWQFRCPADGTVELWADEARRLPATDPAGRELVISCGAALATLALGVRWLGHRPMVTRLPEPTHPMLLARVRLGPRSPVRPWELDMFAAVMSRHTHRGRFDDLPLAPSLLTGLQQLAKEAGARAHLIRHHENLRQVVQWTAAADGAQRQRPAVQAELNRWVRPAGTRRRDGVAAIGAPAAGPGQLTPRSFDRQPGTVTDPATADRPDPVAQHDAGCPPATVLLTTDHDDELAWLLAGEAMQRMLLHAAHYEVCATIHSQPLEVPSIRAQLTTLAGGWHPQMLLQFGHAHSEATSPRRPPAQVLTGPEGFAERASMPST